MHLSGCDVQSLCLCLSQSPKKCMRKVLSFFHVLSAFLSVSQTHMYKYRHLSPDPPLTHLPQLFLGTPENIMSAKQTQRAVQPVHMTCAPLLLSQVPLTLTEVHRTPLMSCLNKPKPIYIISLKKCVKPY